MLNTGYQTLLSRRMGFAKTTIVVGALLWAAVFACLAYVWHERSEKARAAQQPATTAADTAADVEPEQNQTSVKIGFPARKLPDFDFDECNGGTLGLADLKGKRWVANFIFTSCTSTCPTISRAVMELHDRVKKSAPDVMFVSFTVYPQVDTAEQLKNYSETFTKGNWDRWKFLTGSQQEIYELIVNGFGLYVKENLEASKMPGFEVAHSNRVVLVNEDGIPVGTFLGTQPEDMVKLRRILTGQDEFPQPGPDTGPGFTISTTDGSPLNLQFQVVPADGDEKPASADKSDEPSTEAAPQTSGNNDAPDEPPADASTGDASTGDASTGDTESAAAIRSEAPSTKTVAEHNRLIEERLPPWARLLPSVNAGLNTLAAILLMLGLVAIKQSRKRTHRNLMMTAFITSAVFLLCYLTYHYALGKYTGEHGKKFAGQGAAAIVYPLILWPHIVLAVFVPVLAVRVFQHAFAERWDAHRKLAKVTFPIWMFVSVTGVIIYSMLYHWPWPAEVSVTGDSQAALSRMGIIPSV